MAADAQETIILHRSRGASRHTLLHHATCFRLPLYHNPVRRIVYTQSLKVQTRLCNGPIGLPEDHPGPLISKRAGTQSITRFPGVTGSPSYRLVAKRFAELTTEVRGANGLLVAWSGRSHQARCGWATRKKKRVAGQ